MNIKANHKSKIVRYIFGNIQCFNTKLKRIILKFYRRRSLFLEPITEYDDGFQSQLNILMSPKLILGIQS
jgi:hypothetical protein